MRGGKHTPSATSFRPTRTRSSSLSTRWSHAAANTQPPAIAWPVIAATVGVETARNRQAQQGFEDSLIQLQNLRDGIDGVSLEDEMINLMQYQKGFEASAKFLSTVDEMMGTLMTLKR